MSAADLGALFGEEATVGESAGGGRFARPTVDVPPQQWVAALLTARDRLSCDFFDWLSAVDELPGGFTVVAHVYSTSLHHGLLLRVALPRDAPAVDSVVAVYPGAAWHERETHEMFDIDFVGNDALTPLLLPVEFEGHPLRKEFVLASRVAKPWPGAKEPGESEHTANKRAPMRPPGVPDPSEWPGGRV
jgi:NADH-quinone oxidoreductase subunit C